MALAGTIGYTIGSIGGWWIGARGGRPFLERHGRWLHLNAAKLDRAERWFDRWEDWAVFLGRITPGRPLVRLDPGRRLPRAASALHAADAARLGDLVLRLRGRRLGARLAAGRSSTTRFRYVDYAIVATSWQGSAIWRWKLVRATPKAGVRRR